MIVILLIILIIIMKIMCNINVMYVVILIIWK